LGVDQLLEMSFLEFGVTGDDFVVVGNNSSFVRLLRYNEEVIVLTHDIAADKSSRIAIVDITAWCE